MPDKLKSRKLWATVAILAIATGELHAGHLQSSDWVHVVQIILPVWLLGQAAVDAIAKMGAE